MSQFETVDYVFILILLLSTLFGAARGFIREAFTLANLVLASLFTYFFFPYSYDFFAKQMHNNTVIIVCSVFVVFIIAWIIIAIINSFVVDSIGKVKGSGFDRLLGTAFGLIRGALIVIAIFLGIKMGYKAQEDEKNLPEWMTGAKTYHFVKMESDFFLGMMPQNFIKIYKAGVGDLTTNVVDTLSPHGMLSDEERKMLDYGLSHKNVETLKSIMHDLGPNGTRDIDFSDLGKLDKKEFKSYAQDTISDYNSALKSGKLKPRLTKQQIDSLKRSVDSIEDDAPAPDLYKGDY